MKTKLLSGPEVLHEYLLVLHPNEDLCDRIFEVKKEFAATYKSVNALTKPRIHVVSFVQTEAAEQKFTRTFERIIGSLKPISIELKNFGSLPSHTIFINIESKLQIKNLIKELRQTQLLLRLNKEHKPHFINDPILSIVTKLKPWQYEKGWLDFFQRHFSGRFMVESIELMKRVQGEKVYKTIKQFKMMNIPFELKQGQLF